MSPAYYAIFAAVAGGVPGELLPARFTAPRHRDLPRLIDRHYADLPWHQREALKSGWRRSYAARLTADYNMRRELGRPEAKQVIQDAIGVLRRVGVRDA